MKNTLPITYRKPADFNAIELAFWNQYGIQIKDLETFDVLAIDSYLLNNIENTRSNEELIFGYLISEYCVKIYQPLHNKFRFLWIGEKPENYVFGESQLQETTDTVYLTGGEKDVISLAAHGFQAICLSSETAVLSESLVTKIKNQSENLVVLYDNDSTGIKFSQRNSKEHNLPNLILPDTLNGIKYGKDISDLYKYLESIPATNSDLISQLTKTAINNKLKNNSKFLNKLMKTEIDLKNRKSNNIEFNQPLLYRHLNPILYANTLMVIQGKAGTHKSRVAEIISATLIREKGNQQPLLGFEPNYNKRVTLCYIDTERNQKDQFPSAIQRILRLAGYDNSQNPNNFRYNSLLNITRSERMEALKDYIVSLRQTLEGELVIVLDVLTDCWYDFNNAKDSLELIDILNTYINNHNITFICLIHENPGMGNKARGHVGTEISNKATTVLQVGIDRHDKDETDLIKLDFMKCRNTKRYIPFYSVFDEQSKTLVEATDSLIHSFLAPKSSKAPIDELINYLGNNLTNKILKKDLITQITNEFGCSVSLCEKQIQQIITEEKLIPTKKGDMILSKHTFNGQRTYNLEPIN